MDGVDEGGFQILDSGFHERRLPPGLGSLEPRSSDSVAPYGVRDVGFSVQVEFRYKDSMLETEDAIQGGSGLGRRHGHRRGPRVLGAPSCRSRPEGVPRERRNLGVIFAPCDELED